MSYNKKEIENIVYKDYTSTSNEKSYRDNSNRPDSLISIMRDHLIIWQDISTEEISKDNK